jgi:hypothetical protein
MEKFSSWRMGRIPSKKMTSGRNMVLLHQIMALAHLSKRWFWWVLVFLRTFWHSKEVESGRNNGQ